MHSRAHVFIRGFVQGIGFRAWTKRRAEALMLTGWVKNRPDGSVEAVFEGAQVALTEMIEALHTGPEAAEVEEVDAQFGKYTGDFENFSLKTS